MQQKGADPSEGVGDVDMAQLNESYNCSSLRKTFANQMTLATLLVFLKDEALPKLKGGR